MSRLILDIGRFLAHKRSMGHTYAREEGFLKEISRLMEARQDAFLSEAFAREYLSRWTGAGRPNRLTVLRALARFLVVDEPRTFVPPPRFIGIRRRRPAIGVISRDQASRFLRACDILPEFRAHPNGLVQAMALRVLLMTGVRRCELLALRDQDVDLEAGILTIRRGKFGKSRFVPVAADLTQRLRTYREAVSCATSPPRPTSPFFPRVRGKALACKTLYRAFRRTLMLAGIKHGGRGEGPRLHDLRHAFAGMRLLRWYETGQTSA
jgi:integrase